MRRSRLKLIMTPILILSLFSAFFRSIFIDLSNATATAANSTEIHPPGSRCEAAQQGALGGFSQNWHRNDHHKVWKVSTKCTQYNEATIFLRKNKNFTSSVCYIFSLAGPSSLSFVERDVEEKTPHANENSKLISRVSSSCLDGAQRE